MKKKYWIVTLILIIIAVLAIIFRSGLIYFGPPEELFLLLPPPGNINCSSFSYDNCPDECVVCPPCEVCSSVICQTEDFCENIGFERNWWESVRQK